MSINKEKIPFINIFLARRLDDISYIIINNKDLYTDVVSMAEAVYNNNFLILNKLRNDVYNKDSNHYLWKYDFYSRYNFKDSYYLDARKVNVLGTGFDIKVPWEISRMEYLFALAMGYRATKEEKYVSKIFYIIDDFIDCNPYNYGVNWDVSMEIGIRLANIVLACELIQDSPIFHNHYEKIKDLAFKHAFHIKENLENNRIPNNHYLGDLLGLATAYALIPNLFNKEDFNFVIQETHNEIKRQVLFDGVDFECSTSYQRLSGEIIAFTIIALSKIGFSLDDEERELLKRMCEFTILIMDRNKKVPRVADLDSGRVFQLFLEEDSNHSFYLNVMLSLVTNRIFNKDCLYKYGSFIFSKCDEEINISRDSETIHFKASDFVSYKNDNYSLFVSICTPEIFKSHWHAHNDVLSFVLNVDGVEFITDPGVGEYTCSEEKRNVFRTVKNHSTVSIDDNEQRLFSQTSIDAMFDWETIIKKNSVIIKDKTISGSISYIDENKLLLTHERTFKISDVEFLINDVVKNMKHHCHFYLPIHPSIDINVIDEHSVELVNDKRKVLITGSWFFSVGEGIFAYQYKDYVTSKKIIGYSEKSENYCLFKIE